MQGDEHDRLVRSAGSGDPVAVDALLERHLPGLATFVRLRLGTELATREPPLDLVQSVCRDVLEHAAGFEYRGEGAFRNWLYKKALAKICDRKRYWQARKRDRAREEHQTVFAIRSMDDSPSEVLVHEEDVQRLEAAFVLLSEEHREVIELAYIVGLSRREIADEMGRSDEAVRSLLHRALARVGKLMCDPAILGAVDGGQEHEAGA